MELLSKNENGHATIKLPKTVDTVNAAEVEQSINVQIGILGNIDSLTLDASELEYISSVGLRIVLRLKQAYDDLHIIDCKSSVYEIFEMTGFTDMMDIKKAYRRVSIEGCPVIGEGFYGRVYRLSPDTIVKVYFRGGDVNNVIRERLLAKTAFILGIPTAISYDIVKVNEKGKECFGSVFELLDCSSLRDLVRDNPDKLDEYIKMHADLVKKIGSTEVLSKDLPYAKDACKEWLANAKTVLDPKVYDKLEKLIDTIPNSNYMVHGDCHVKNILVQNGEPLLIDMDTLSKGHCIFDIMAFYLSYIAYELTEPGNTKSFLGLEKETCDKLYAGIFNNLFKDRSDKEKEEIQSKIETLGFLLLLYRTLIYYPDDLDRKNLCIEKINKGVKELDTLNF